MKDKRLGEWHHITTEAEKREQEIAALWSGFLRELMKGPRMRKALLMVLGDALQPWTQGNVAQRAFAAQAVKIISAVLNPSPLSQPKIEGKEIGQLITLLARNANARYQANPQYLVEHLKGPLCDAIQYIDFGEIKELLDRAEAPVAALVKALMEFVWNRYPAKLGAVMSFIHPLGNMVVKALKEIVLPLNTIAPDLFADLILSILGSIDGKEIGGLANGILELTRQLHTGSLLQGEAGVSHFQRELTRILRDIASGIDPQLVRKVMVIAAENREERANACADIMLENPDLILELVAHSAAIRNPRIRTIAKKLSVYESLPQAELGEAVSEGVAQIDTQGIAGIFNAAVRLVNGVHDRKPDLFANVVREIVHAVDEDEFQTAAQWMSKDIRDAIRPIEAVVLAAFLNGSQE